MKKLYYQVSDNYDMSNVIMTAQQLTDTMDAVFTDEKDLPKNQQHLFAIEPKWLSDYQFNKLKEAEF